MRTQGLATAGKLLCPRRASTTALATSEASSAFRQAECTASLPHYVAAIPPSRCAGYLTPATTREPKGDSLNGDPRFEVANKHLDGQASTLSFFEGKSRAVHARRMPLRVLASLSDLDLDPRAYAFSAPRSPDSRLMTLPLLAGPQYKGRIPSRPLPQQ